ncbi:glutathione S-transferase family protein [Pelagibacteraceae bacterium]|nr:glutathione S-transferase family protein [Pelagibacteraceae bacterium]
MVQIPSEQIKTKEILDWQGIHLIHFSGSSCSQKLRIYLNYKKIKWQSHSVNIATGQNYSNWFLGINPKGLLPVLVDDGRVIIESNDIIQYLENKFPQPTLISEDQQSSMSGALRNEDNLHIDIRNVAYKYMFGGLGAKKPENLEKFENYKADVDDITLKHKQEEVDFYKNFKKNGITDEAIKKSLTNFEKHYKIFDQQLQNQKFLLGDHLSVLDIAWFIYTYRLTISEFPFKQKYPNVHKWYNLLYVRNEFYKEVKPPFIFYLVRKISLLKARLSKSAIRNFVS